MVIEWALPIHVLAILSMVNLAVPYSSYSIHAPPAHAAYTHRQLMQHSRTASSCSIHAPPAQAAFTHRQLMQHTRTTSSCSIDAPPAHAAFTHRQLMQHSHTASSCSIDAPPAHAAFTHRQYPILTFWGRTRPRVNPGNCQIVHRSFPLDRPL